MKKVIALIAAGMVLALTGCSSPSPAAESTATTEATTSSATASPSAPSAVTPQFTEVTYQATATYDDGTGAPASVIWSTPSREFGDFTSEWEESSSELEPGGYAQVLVTPSDSDVTVNCVILVNGEQVDADEVEASAGRALCEYTLP